MPIVNRLTIVGLGLIGGSLGLAVKRRHVAKEVIGLSRHPATLRRARASRAIDWGTTRVGEAVREADLIIVATPVDTIVPLAHRIATSMRPGSVLSDVGSTKAAIVGALERTLPPRIAFVGAHPLAGSEQQGLSAASPTLFDGSTCVLTPTMRTDRRALRRVDRFWSALGADVITMTPQAHDRLVARTSHLPHLLAYALTQAMTIAPLSRAPRSFLDMTRIAKSAPELWDDIFLSNRAELLDALRRFEQERRALRRAIVHGDRRTLRHLLTRAHAKRHALKDGDT